MPVDGVGAGKIAAPERLPRFCVARSYSPVVAAASGAASYLTVKLVSSLSDAWGADMGKVKRRNDRWPQFCRAKRLYAVGRAITDK
jgi:hypothetical protein